MTLSNDSGRPRSVFAFTFICAVFQLASAHTAQAEVNVWTRLGGPGDVSALAIDPITPTTLYAGTVFEGVYKSTDSGGNWSAANTGLPSVSVLALAIDPTTPSTLYAGIPVGVFSIQQQGTVCIGDCDGTGQVTVDELLSMVNIALGNAGVSTCLPGDANHDQQITVDEILTAVNNALSGCPADGGQYSGVVGLGGPRI